MVVTMGNMDAIFGELKQNPPAVVNATRRKFGAARAQKQDVAIAFSKARKQGLSVPNPKGMNSK